MKKNILIIILLSTILFGCSIANSPTSKTEELLSNYQRLDENIIISYTDLITDININEDLKNNYNDLIKDQYQNLSYEIKEEIIDGNTAVVTTSIDVLDYKKVINKYNKNDYTTNKYHQLIIDDLKNTKTKVTYTIDFTLTKDNKNNWKIDNLSNEQKQKLLGIY